VNFLEKFKGITEIWRKTVGDVFFAHPVYIYMYIYIRLKKYHSSQQLVIIYVLICLLITFSVPFWQFYVYFICFYINCTKIVTKCEQIA
jgi:hypothetical protein